MVYIFCVRWYAGNNKYYKYILIDFFEKKQENLTIIIKKVEAEMKNFYIKEKNYLKMKNFRLNSQSSEKRENYTCWPKYKA